MNFKNTRLTLLALLAIPVGLSAQNKKLKRAESFFGFHFDFHATANDKDLGKYFDEKKLEEFISRTKPDYVQIDSKGHPGYSSYPTKAGYSPNSFTADPMQLWRKVTNKFNTAMYVHYSGIMDDKGISTNPQWGRVNADGSKDPGRAAYLGEYSDKLMIPQLKEMIDWYGIDGAWVDGDCWATGPDYSPEVVAGFKKATGAAEAPVKAEDPLYKDWLAYNRVAYKQYLKHYIDAIHAYKPNFQIASNWAYSSMMPEKVDIGVDFLSGDVSGQNCVYSAAFQARCLALQGKPWDLMAWGFAPMDFSGGIHSPKSLVQLQQEAAEVMAVGGGFQVYFQQNRDASFQNSINIDDMAALAKFCKSRQPFCQGSTVVPQIGMWYSGEGWKQQNGGVYGWGSNMEAINNLLIDGQQSVEILMDHHMEQRLEKYPVIVIPEWYQFDAKLKARLIEHVKAGGSLLVIGAKATEEFEPYMGVEFDGVDTLKQFNIGDEKYKGITGIRTHWQKVAPKAGTQSLGHVYYQRDYRFATQYPVATVASLGKGKIAGIYMDMGGPYNTWRHPVYNRIVNDAIAAIYPDAKVKVTGNDKLHVVLAQKNAKTLVHLINADGAHFNGRVFGYDTISPALQVSVELASAKKPKTVKLQPDGKPLAFTYEKQKIKVKVPSVSVYSLVEVAY